MNTGSSVSKGTSNFFIHIVIGAMRLSHPKKNISRKIQIFSEIANSDMVESASHPHPIPMGVLQVCLMHED